MEIITIKQGFLNYQNKKHFVNFCIHDDTHPYLEGYVKKIHSPSHNPAFTLDLAKTKHVGFQIPSNGHHQDTFDFVIVFENGDVVSLAAKTWNLMIEWANCIKLKLRELKILSPKENIYTKPPEMRPILVSTRNPTDPLPQPPMNVADIPGLEVIETHHETIISDTQNENGISNIEIESTIETLTISEPSYQHNIINNDNDDDGADPITIPVFNFATSNTSSQNLINLLSNPLRHSNNSSRMIPFGDAFEMDLEDDDDEGHEATDEMLENIPPTSLHIDYVPEDHQNVTIIPVAQYQQQQFSHLPKDAKVTKIKIEMDYDQLFLASSSSPAKKVEPTPQAVNKETEEASTQRQEPSTSNGTNDIQVETPKRAPPSIPKRTPTHEKRKLSLREQQVVHLEREIGKEIRFKLRKKDCVDTIAFVPAFGRTWIAGFKPNPLLYVLHVGDQLLAINNIVIKSPADAHKIIKACNGLFTEVTIIRLPLARIFVLKRDFEQQCLGIIRDGHTPTIVEVIPNSLASRSGIPPRPPNNHSEDDSIFWIITEINFRPLSLINHKKYDETDLLLNAIGLETSLLLHPSDFIAKLKKELKTLKNYRDYTLQ